MDCIPRSNIAWQGKYSCLSFTENKRAENNLTPFFSMCGLSKGKGKINKR